MQPPRHASHFPLSDGSRITARHVWRRAACLVITALASASAQADTAATLPAVQIVGDGDGTTTEGTGAYTPQTTAAGTGLPLSLRETPQSVTVITRQRIEDQDMRSLADIMASTPGISTQNDNDQQYAFNARGFRITNPGWGDTLTTAYRDTTTQTGWYGALRLSLADPLRLIVGGRYSTWKRDHHGWAGSHYLFKKHNLTPYAGLLYDLGDRYTAYVSYTGIFNSQSYQDRNGD